MRLDLAHAHVIRPAQPPHGSHREVLQHVDPVLMFPLGPEVDRGIDVLIDGGRISSAGLPLGLLAVGAGLSLARGTLPLPALAWWSGVKLLALPAIAYALGLLAGLSPLERQIAVVMAAVPTAPSAYLLAMQMSGHGAPVAVLISTGTLLAAVTLPLWVALAGSFAGG